MQRAESQDPATELEVLKCILLREGYLKRLRDLGVNAGGSGNRVEVVDILDLLRIATVDTVECIVRWREAQAKPYPFVWNGINYLVKIPSDLDFLDEVVPLTSWLGFSLLRNPFVVPNPMPLEEAPNKSPSYGSAVDHSIHPSLEPPKVRGPGGVPVSNFQQESIHAGTNHDPTVSATDNDYVKIGGHPVVIPAGGGGGRRGYRDPTGSIYQAPILNDADMQVTAGGRPKKGGRAGGKLGRSGGARGGGGEGASALPSVIGDLDMVRVRYAEEQILREEGTYGRFMRDRSGIGCTLTMNGIRQQNNIPRTTRTTR